MEAGKPFTRRRALLAAGAALVSTLAACTATAPQRFSGNAEDKTAEALDAVNRLRAERGLGPLAPERAARAAALHQAGRMAANGRMTHLIGLTDNFGVRMKQAGVALPAAENIASGQNETARAVAAWAASPNHLTNMLGPYRSVGVAVARDPASGNRPYWAMVLSN